MAEEQNARPVFIVGGREVDFNGAPVGEAETVATDVASLQAQVASLQQQVADAKAAQGGSPEDAAALQAYRDSVGDLLPDGLASNARKSLLDGGYVGKKILARTADDELRKLSGVGDGTITALRVFAPYVAPETPPAQ